jgi:hypothetical protein
MTALIVLSPSNCYCGDFCTWFIEWFDVWESDDFCTWFDVIEWFWWFDVWWLGFGAAHAFRVAYPKYDH